MVALADALGVLFPAAVPLRDYEVRDDGTGPRIAAWHLPDPQPTAEQIAAVTPAQVAAARLVKPRTLALTTFVARADDTAIAVRLLLDAVCTLANDEFQALGRGRPLTIDKLMAYVAANPTAGDPLQ